MAAQLRRAVWFRSRDLKSDGGGGGTMCSRDKVGWRGLDVELAMIVY